MFTGIGRRVLGGGAAASAHLGRLPLLQRSLQLAQAALQHGGILQRQAWQGPGVAVVGGCHN